MKTITEKVLKSLLGVIVVVLLLMGFKLHFFGKQDVDSSLYSIEVIDPSVRGTEKGSKLTPYEKGLNAYFVKKDFKSAITHFLQSESPAGKFFLGISLLQSGEYAKAEIVLNEVLKLEDDFPHHLTTFEDVKWFLILSKLGNGGYESTHAAIADVDEFLRNPSEKYKPHAEKLKEKLASPLYAFTKSF